MSTFQVPIERFRQVALFADLSDADLARICSEAVDVRLQPGEILFREGEPGDRAFVVTDGKLEIRKFVDQSEMLIAVRGEGEVIGEMALLQSEPRSATVSARTPATLISIPRSALDDLLATSPDAARAIFTPLIQRIRETNDQLRHHERMAQLGVMTAGVAHELNNPAAALQRAAAQFSDDVARLTDLAARGPFPGMLDLIHELESRPPTTREAVARADAVEALEEWLEAHDVPDAWELAPDLVEAGLEIADLDCLQGRADLADSVAFVARVMAVRGTARTMSEGSTRLSDIVGVLRSYTFLDRAPVQEVEIVRGVEDTLVLMGGDTAGITIIREYDDDLPAVTASGAELNQVWTNLIKNASDALAETAEPTLTLRVRKAQDKVVVEVEDNGPGVPEDIQHRVFDAFFTTKPPGQGTGLGLQVSYRVVVLEHGGDLTMESRPGRTVFRVTLPIRPPEPTTGSNEGSESLSPPPCEHLEVVENSPKPEGGCRECEALGDTWVHLRFCATCGAIGCCNDSKNRHATRHAEETGHPVIRTREPRENWAYCYEHQIGMVLPPLD